MARCAICAIRINITIEPWRTCLSHPKSGAVRRLCAGRVGTHRFYQATRLARMPERRDIFQPGETIAAVGGFQQYADQAAAAQPEPPHQVLIGAQIVSHYGGTTVGAHRHCPLL